MSLLLGAYARFDTSNDAFYDAKVKQSASAKSSRLVHLVLPFPESSCSGKRELSRVRLFLLYWKFTRESRVCLFLLTGNLRGSFL